MAKGGTAGRARGTGGEGSPGASGAGRVFRGRRAPRESFHPRGTEVLPGGREEARLLLPKVVPQELDRKDPVAVQLLDLRAVGPAPRCLLGPAGLPALYHPP